jgi:hypothetical protein
MTTLSWLGRASRYGEYVGFECPRCGGHRTHATPRLNLWRCWACERIDRFDRVAHLPRRPSNAPTTSRAELPRRRTISLEVVEVLTA